MFYDETSVSARILNPPHSALLSHCTLRDPHVSDQASRPVPLLRSNVPDFGNWYVMQSFVIPFMRLRHGESGSDAW